MNLREKIFGIRKPEVNAKLEENKERLRSALVAAPTVYEVLARPDSYARWYNGERKEALATPVSDQVQ